jgi:hypothetical protein
VSDKRSSQAIERFYLSDDPTILLNEDDTANFNAELDALVRQKLEEVASRKTNGSATIASIDPETRLQIFGQAQLHIDTVKDPFNFEYVLERLLASIFAAEAIEDGDEVSRLENLRSKMETQELSPIQIVREAWLKVS